MRPVIVIINGPGLNRLGERQPGIYGTETPEDVLRRLRERFPQADMVWRQSNAEGELIDILQEVAFGTPGRKTAGIVLNPGAYAHYSYALADAVADVVADAAIPVVEVHISNIHAREAFRAVSVTARAAVGVITGLGTRGYDAAVAYLLGRDGKGA